MMRKLAVLELRRSVGVGGPEVLIFSIFKHLDKDRFKVYACTFRDRKRRAEDFIGHARGLGMEVATIDTFFNLSPLVLLKLSLLIKRLGIDLIHTHDPKSDLAARIVAPAFRIPVISSAHGFTKISRTHRVWDAVHLFSLRYAANVLVGSRSMKADLVRQGVPRRSIHVVLQGTDPEAAEGIDRRAARAELLARTGLPETAFLIGHLSRLSPEKGQHQLIEAMAAVLGAVPEARLLIAGTGPARPSLEETVRRLKLEETVRFLGFFEEKGVFFKGIDVFVFVSIAPQEILPLVLLEAMAAGTPVVSCDKGGIPEMIEPGREGILVPSGDPSSLARALISLAKDKNARELYGRKGRERVLEEFTERSMVESIGRLYLEAAGLAAPEPRRGPLTERVSHNEKQKEKKGEPLT